MELSKYMKILYRIYLVTNVILKYSKYIKYNFNSNFIILSGSKMLIMFYNI